MNMPRVSAIPHAATIFAPLIAPPLPTFNRRFIRKDGLARIILLASEFRRATVFRGPATGFVRGGRRRRARSRVLVAGVLPSDQWRPPPNSDLHAGTHRHGTPLVDRVADH